MRDFYPDIFDALGFLPREYGGVQIFVEPVERDPRGRATAEVWLQAAYEPIPEGATLSVLLGDGSGGLELSTYPLPALAAGRVVRWRIPFSVSVEAERICFKVKAAAGAERVRPNRRQDEASRGPAISDMGLSMKSGGGSGIGGTLATTAALNAMSLPFGTLVIPLSFGDDGGDGHEYVSTPIGLPVEEMPHGYVARVTSGEPVPLDAPAFEVMWEPGMPMPRAETAIRVRANAKKKETWERVCLSCGHRTDSLSAVSCPLCGSLL